MAGILLVANVALRHLYSQLPLLAGPQAVADQQLASARRALEQRNPEKAVAQLQGVIAQEPRAAEPRYLLGEAYLMQHQPDPAISAFQETLRLDPRYGAAAAGLGSAYLAKGMKAEAAEAFKEAAALGYQGN
jgi:cytochrome c-type biogenesis protein CcmH/NrfG